MDFQSKCDALTLEDFQSACDAVTLNSLKRIDSKIERVIQTRFGVTIEEINLKSKKWVRNWILLQLILLTYLSYLRTQERSMFGHFFLYSR
jgi:hypothetical protein